MSSLVVLDVTNEPLVPFEFEYRGPVHETKHLEFEAANARRIVRWPLLGIHAVVPDVEEYVDVDDIQKLNGDAFRDWNRRGFSLGTYHEFFCYPLGGIHAAFKVSGAEVSFGYATPLASYLYDAHHDNDYFDEWESLTTARIVGANQENLEAIFVSAALAYQHRFNRLPRVMRLDTSEFYEEEQEEEEPQVFSIPPAIREVEPLRFHYYGLVQADPVAACIYFYRVLEYFSFSIQHGQISKLRHDAALSDQEFAKRIVEIAFRDEKGPLLHLINVVTDDAILGGAIDAVLVKAKDASQLGAALYAFRNSIVHGKHAAGYPLDASSVLSGGAAALAWRGTLRALSERCLQVLGQKLI